VTPLLVVLRPVEREPRPVDSELMPVEVEVDSELVLSTRSSARWTAN
jgi:hypothetical protein